MDPSDDQIIEQTLGGETEAFNLLVRRWERQIYGLSLRLTGREEEARDICQETFIAAYRNLGKFRREASFSSWIYRIAINACHTRQRRQNQRAEIPIVSNEEADSNIELASDDRGRSVPEELERDQRARLVRKALQALPPDLRQVIVMKEYQDLTFAEIGEILDIPVSTVKSRLYTGLGQMRARLERLRGVL
jgi:RNA polymerase sigma-70 factor, ECF subfamily